MQGPEKRVKRPDLGKDFWSPGIHGVCKARGVATTAELGKGDRRGGDAKVLGGARRGREA